MLAGMEEVGTGLLDRLDAMQRVAASAPGGPLLIVAGPGTGKTRTLTHRIAYLCAELDVFPEQCLAITFTRRAAEELRERLDALLGPVAEDVTVGTFHALGLTILRENADAAGLPPDFADRRRRRRCGRGRAERRPAHDAWPRTAKLLREQDLVDLDELMTLPRRSCCATTPALVDALPRPLAVDLRRRVPGRRRRSSTSCCGCSAPPDGNLCAIGDPDQAIYSFRGADVALLPALRRGLHRRPAGPADPQLPLVGADPGRGRAGDRADVAGPRPAARPGPARPGGAAGRAATRRRRVADEADFVVRTVDELVGGLSHRSLDSAGSTRGRPPARCRSPTSRCCTAPTRRPRRSSTRCRGPACRCRSARTTGCGTGPASPRIARELRLRRPASAGRCAARVRLAGAGARRAVRRADAGRRRHGLRRADVWTARRAAHAAGRSGAATTWTRSCALATGAEVDALDPRAEAVTLLTLHAAKGLEFPVVFLVGCEDGLLPLRLPGSQGRSEDDIAEERRLFFVGLTRAQDRLFLSHSRRASGTGRSGTWRRRRSCRPSTPACSSGAAPRRPASPRTGSSA